MGFITRYGTIWGQVPDFQGRVFFVAPGSPYTVDGRSYDASDGNDGVSPERALRTINQAVTNATANAGDVILLLEGTHTQTAIQRITKAGLTIHGMRSYNTTFNAYRPRTILTSTGTSINLLSVEASNTEIGYLMLRPTTAYNTVIFPSAAALDNIYIHHVNVDLSTPAVNLGTTGINLGYRNATALTYLGGDFTLQAGGGIISANTNVLIEDSVFVSGGAQGPALIIASAYAVVKRSHAYNTAGTWATAFKVATDTDNTMIEACIFTSTATLSAPIDGAFANNAEGCMVYNCRFGRFGATLAIRNFGSNECSAAENYTADSATAGVVTTQTQL